MQGPWAKEGAVTLAVASLGVGIKTQTPNVMDGLSVFENIWLAARRFHVPTEANRKTDEVIERLALSPIARADLGHLAHGERQRVELGLVAVGDPWLVLLDEPAAGMSADDVARMTDIIHELQKTAAVVIVEHDMQFIRSIAQTVRFACSLANSFRNNTVAGSMARRRT